MLTHSLTRPSTAAVMSLLTLAAASAAHAQTPTPSEPLTLEQALQIAEAQSESIAGAQAGIRRAEAQITQSRAGRFPQLSASASYDRALASEFSGVFDRSGAPQCDPFMLDPTAPLEARVAEIERAIDCGAIGASLFGGGASQDDGNGDVSLPFGRENTWRYTLSFSQSLYSGGRFGALEAMARAGRETAGLTLDSTRAQLLFDVTQAYYDAALSDRLVAIAEATLEQSEATLRQVEASYEAGAQPEFELVRARVTRDNQRPPLIRQRANRDIAMLRLKQLLELPPDTDLQLAASLTNDVLTPPAPFAERLAAVSAVTPPAQPPAAPSDLATLTDRNAVREAAATVRLREAGLDSARAERRPSVSLGSTFSQVAYPTNFFPTGDFRTNWTIGASVQMPVLTGGRLSATQDIARAELDQSRADLEQVEELAALDTRSAWAELVAAQAAWEASAGTVQQAVRAYDIADVRYRAGVSTQLELSDARLLLQQSEANRAQAARDLQVARARIALLPNLPLSTAPAGRITLPEQTTPATPLPAPTPQAPAGGTLRNAATQPTSPPGGPQ